MVNTIFNSTKDDNYLEWLTEHTPKIKAIIDCLNGRIYQHRNCYKYSGSIIKKPSEISNKSHMRNLTTLCSGLLKLYVLYEKNLKTFNDTNKNKKPNLLLELNLQTANNCRNSLRDTEFPYILKELGLTDSDISKLETKGRKIYSEVRSRESNAYVIKNKTTNKHKRIESRDKTNSKRAYKIKQGKKH